MRFLVSLVLFSQIILFVPAVYATFTPPSYCIEGRTISNLKTESPTYIAVNMPTRIKADFHFNPLDNDKEVLFYNSYDGYVDQRLTDSWDNAYTDMLFPLASQGQQTIWINDVTDFNNSYCSMTTAYIQSMPTASVLSASGGGQITISLQASISMYSKRQVENNTFLPLITYRFQNTDYTYVETMQTTSQTVSFAPKYQGFHWVTASVSDGTFTRAINVGSLYFSGGIVPAGPIN
ncbi:hypothetical protein KJ365_16590 [Glaciecola sp. XM2]|jgi:hypothetical protein|uniref:hypothetical protein n=1 Tax=Glaciecola sp. XM2 TaxID=1914931 RepID=UPI001BDE89C3|nr:hypothetical protein [Glaciecola sp. XM2]MBT1452502.1 hypothetical protein [Glaciecola sp. XM2]